MTGKALKRVVLMMVLVLPFLVYYIFVYSAEENFFVTLEYVGPREIKQVVEPDGTPRDTAYYSVPKWEFLTQDDSLLSSTEMLGNITLVNFFFTSCPSICPAMNFNVQQIQERFKNYDYFKIVSFTVDPEYDTVEVLKAYERRIGANSGRWYFLTGDKAEIYQTAADHFLSAMEDEAAEGGFLHSQNLVLVDWNGHIRSGRDEDGNLRGVYDGLSPKIIQELKSDIKVLIAENEKNKSVKEYREEKAQEDE
jgi:protein SCO1/2